MQQQQERFVTRINISNVIQHQLQILKLLIKNGAQLDVRDTTGKTALHVAAK